MARARPSWPWWRWVLTGLIALALALSSYLGWHYVVGGTVIGCAGGSSCDQVLGSRWSTIGGVVPVSGLAAGAYLAMLVASFYLGPATPAPIRRLAWCALLILTGAAAGGAVWFTILQKWVIGAFCPYCMATHLTGVALAALVIGQAPRQFDGDATGHAPMAPRLLSRAKALSLAANGLVLASILAAGQVLFVPAATFQSGDSNTVRLPVLDPRAVPLIGSPDAPYIVTLLFDYKCPHCQQLHTLLDEVVRRYHGRLAFALCPSPLNTACNPYIPHDVDAFKDSCELARVALAVWVARRDAFADFDRWLYSPAPGDAWHARTLDEARAKAVALLGPAKFDAALADPWVNRHLQASVQIFGATNAGAVPKLVFGARWVNPEPNNADDLIAILQGSLGVPSP